MQTKAKQAEAAETAEAPPVNQELVDEMRRRYDAPDDQWMTLEEFEQHWNI